MSGLEIFLFSNSMLLDGMTATALASMQFRKWFFLPRPFSASEISLKDSKLTRLKQIGFA